MVVRFGMSDRVGRVRLAAPASDVFLGGSAALGDLSEEMRRRVEAETARLVEGAFERAAAVLGAHRSVLEEMVARLLADEVLEGAALQEFLTGVGAGPVAVTPAGR